MEKFTFIAFGDSLTFGYGASPGVPYPSRLARDYPDWKVVNSGVNGETTREAIERIDRDVLSHQPQVVAFFYGSNDSSLFDDYYRPLIEFDKHTRQMLEKIMATTHGTDFNGGHTLPIFITAPPLVETDFLPSNTNDRLEVYADAIKRIATEANVPVIDFYTTLLAKKEEDFESFFQSDGDHLSKLGYDLLYGMITDALATYVLPQL